MTSLYPLELISAAAAALWLIIILLLHFTKPELDPRTRMISEYAREPHGWIMQLAFFCMALSCGALAVAMWALPLLLGSALLTICSVGFAGAGIFVTDPVSLAQRTQTRSGALHVLFAFIVIVIFPIMATVVVRDGRCGAGTGPAWMGSGKRSALGAVAAREGRSILPESMDAT